MKILLLDIYKETEHRISKDTSGGYGTGNNFGDNIFCNFLKKKFKQNHDWPPLFSAYSYTVLKKQNHEIDFLRKKLSNYNDYDLVIVTSSIVCCETETTEIKKIISQGIKVFVIGPFASNNPQKYLNSGAVVISGEPEFFFLNNEILDLPDQPTILKSSKSSGSLDLLPIPDWEDILDSTKKVSNLFGSYNSLPILATRGCPFSCFEYCVYPLQQGRVVRQRSPIEIVNELEMWSQKEVKMFIFRDPVFSINKKHTEEFCNILIQKNLKIRFVIETHLRILDSNLIDLLKKAGMKGVKVGVESADTEVLKNASRYSIAKDLQFRKIRELEKKNIQVSAMYIIGFPTDNSQTIQDTIDYAIKLNTTYAQFSVWTPYPGTPIFKTFEKEISTTKFEDFDQYNLVYNHKLFSSKEIRKLLSNAYSAYYLRLRWIFKYVNSFFFS
jgi:anaerobic magnesium-protoporphyrin IX monomethyl ester cyclase